MANAEYNQRMEALKSRWEELGDKEKFADIVGVDHELNRAKTVKEM